MTHKSLPLIPLGVVLQLLVGPLSCSILVGKSLSRVLRGFSSRLWIVASVLPQSVYSMITIKGVSFQKGESSLESSEFPSLPLSFRDCFMTGDWFGYPRRGSLPISHFCGLLIDISNVYPTSSGLGPALWRGVDDVPILVCYPLLTMI